MNLRTPDTQLPQSSLTHSMRPLTEAELDAIVGGVKVTITNKKGETVVIEL